MDTETEKEPAAPPAVKKPKKKRFKKQGPKHIGKPRPKKAKKPVKKVAGSVRTERLDLRLTKAEKAKLHARSKKTRRTVTSLIIELIERMK